METNITKESLHRFADNVDEKPLCAAVSEYAGEEDFIFIDVDIKEFEKRSADRRSRKSKSYSWQDAKQMIVAK